MEGILASDLAKGNFSNYFSNKQEPSQEKGTGIYLLLLPALGAALIGAIILFKKHK